MNFLKVTQPLSGKLALDTRSVGLSDTKAQAVAITRSLSSIYKRFPSPLPVKFKPQDDSCVRAYTKQNVGACKGSHEMAWRSGSCPEFLCSCCFPGHIGKHLRRHGPCLCLVYERGQKYVRKIPPYTHAHPNALSIPSARDYQLFCKRLDTEYFKLCRPDSVCHNYSTPPSWHENSHGQYVNKWVWLCSNKTALS